MRLLSDIEKDLCRLILNGAGQNNYLTNVLDHKLVGVCISVDRTANKVELQINRDANAVPNTLTNEENERIFQRIKEVSTDIVTAVNLVELLEKEGYIILFQRANQIPNTSRSGGCVGNLPSVTHKFPDRRISELWIEFESKDIIVTAAFEEFCARGFIAQDEQRFRTQKCISIIAISIALFIGCSNIGFNVWSKHTEAKVRPTQVDSLGMELKRIEIGIDTLNVTSKQIMVNAHLKSVMKEKKKLSN